MTIDLSRRSFLSYAGVTLLASAFPFRLWAQPRSPLETKTLPLFHTHTGEAQTFSLWHKGNFCQQTLQQLNHFLRDHRAQEVHPIAPAVLDFLHQIYLESGSQGVIHIISGYRSSKTNTALRRASKGIAKNSFHLKGQAIDFHISDQPLSKIKSIAQRLKRGGVGYYPNKFVHIDCGPIRTW